MTVTDRIGEPKESSRMVWELYKATGLDLGCCNASHTRRLPQMTYVDLVRRENPPDGMIEMDILKVPSMYVGKKFGVVYLLDVVEHLYQEPAMKLLKELESITERIVVFTPLGELWMNIEDGPGGHHSAWTPEMFEAIGYETWTWPRYHQFPNGDTAGAFWAWKDIGKENLTAERLSQIARVKI
jgi:hypothetical protein